MNKDILKHKDFEFVLIFKKLYPKIFAKKW